MRGLATRVLGGVLVGAAIGAGCALPAPVPQGFAFPTWSTGGGGAAALLEGDLRAIGGCLYVERPSGGRHLVIWPDTWRLVLDGGLPVVMDGDTEVVRGGRDVSLGGGELTPGLIPRSADGCDTTLVWGANSVVDPEQLPAP